MSYIKKPITVLLAAILLSGCVSAHTETKSEQDPDIVGSLNQLQFSTSTRVLKEGLENSLLDGTIGGITETADGYTFKDMGISYGSTNHSVEIKNTRAGKEIRFDGNIVKESLESVVFSDKNKQPVESFDPYISKVLMTAKPGKVSYQPPYSSLGELNELLLKRMDYQNSFVLSKIEMDRLVFSLLAFGYSIDQYAAIGDSDLYVTVRTNSRNAFLYYKGGKLLVGGFVYEEGSLF